MAKYSKLTLMIAEHFKMDVESTDAVIQAVLRVALVAILVFGAPGIIDAIGRLIAVLMGR